jgi:hypothetical protein
MKFSPSGAPFKPPGASSASTLVSMLTGIAGAGSTGGAGAGSTGAGGGASPEHATRVLKNNTGKARENIRSN